MTKAQDLTKLETLVDAVHDPEAHKGNMSDDQRECPACHAITLSRKLHKAEPDNAVLKATHTYFVEREKAVAEARLTAKLNGADRRAIRDKPASEMKDAIKAERQK